MEPTHRSLPEAASLGDLEHVKVLIQQGVPIDTSDEYGDTALCKAARNGHQEIIDFLLDSGADINHRGGANLSAIMQAAVEGRVGLVRNLVQRGALVSADLVNTIHMKVGILIENAEAGYVRPEAADAWRDFLEYLVSVYHKQNP